MNEIFKNLEKSKYLSRASVYNMYSDFYFKIDSEIEISLHFENIKLHHVGLHISDFSTHSTDIKIKSYEIFLQLFKILAGDEFDIL